LHYTNQSQRADDTNQTDDTTDVIAAIAMNKSKDGNGGHL
jgi:hypothetical protein